MGFLPLNLRALVYVIIAFSGAIFFLNRLFDDKEELKKWALLWIGIACVTYTIPSFLGLVGVVILISYYYIPKENINRALVYFLILPIIAARIKYSVDFIPGINYLIIVNYPELLALIILLPGLIKIVRDKESNVKFRIFDSSTDFFVVSYFFLISILQFSRQPTMTASLREVFIQFMHFIIPYYAISRSVTSLNQFHKIYKAISFSAILVACVGALEQVTKWSFFSVLPSHLGVPYDRNVVWASYRSGFMRIKSLLGEEIPLGFFLMLSLGTILFFRHSKSDRKLANPIVYLIMLITIYLTDSRGAQLGTIVLVFVYVLFAMKNVLIKLIVVSVMIFGFMFFLFSDITIDSIDQHGTFTYRVELVQNAMPVINQNYWFGSDDFLESEDLERSRQGQGLIDIVNTYLFITLNFGVAGLILFSLVFLSSVWKVYLKMKQIKPNSNEENKAYGAVLLAMLISMMLVIVTVSPVGHIPFYCWAMIGLGSAYHRLSPDDLNKGNQAKNKDNEDIINLLPHLSAADLEKYRKL